MLMIAIPIAALLQRVKTGVLDPADTAMLEQTSASQVVQELRSIYPVVYQERRIGKKWEISMARSVRAELIRHPLGAGRLVTFRLVPVYVNCLSLSAEEDRVTGISRRSRLQAWAVSKPEPGLALKSGRGFKLDHTVDGWVMQALRGRTVRLPEHFLRTRGCRFDHLNQVVPAS
jgi:hypothetical protein